MSSATKKSSIRRANRHKKMGRRRKAVEGRRSTMSAAELFAACGEPGKPAPAPAKAPK
jgi:hypothetical protein